MPKPNISVCMASFNGEKYIEEQIHSILMQLAPTDELIISDDNSTDNTLEIISKIKDERIIIKINDNGKGYTKNFENAIKYSKGKYIFLTDQDDVWLPNKIEESLLHLKKKNVQLVISDATHVDASLNTQHPSHFNLCGVKKGFLHNFLRTRYIGACMAFTDDFKTKILPFPKKDKFCAHDYWITLCGEIERKTYLIEESLILYRRHGNNVSTAGVNSDRSVFKKIVSRAYSLFKLFFRKISLGGING